MDKVYKYQKVEKKWYQKWEKGGYFTPEIDKSKKPFTIILPPPNANADLHLGHAMYVVEDILIRYQRMRGYSALWLAGADHAGFETQYVFEKKLSKEGKNRLDFDKNSLFKMIWDFVHDNKTTMENQLRRLGFSLDWTRNVFTLDPKIVSIVLDTFKKLFDDGLVYRDLKLVNYCVRCGTAFSDLEVKHIEQKDPLYYLKYGPFILATTRPETKFGDTAVAVNPKDKRYQKWIGQKIEVEGLIGKFRIKVIEDDVVDPKFGTGIVKVTPAHDHTDFEIGKRHNLTVKQVIGFDGRLNEICGKYQGLKIKPAREVIVKDLQEKNLLDHIDENYSHSIGVCYKCNTVIEPLPLPQWYVKIKPLAEKAIKAIRDKKISFYPKRYEKIALDWLKNFHDWNISRQIVWGIRIPAWHCKDCKNDKWIVTSGETPKKCPDCASTNLMQDTDTFDTWFSSSQWPFATLQKTGGDSFKYFYPTSVMETGYDILPWWVLRMIMMGLYKTGNIPFRTVLLHGLVRDKKGQKMSKSKNNVINPISMIDLYGADSLRFALIYGTAFGNDIPMSEDKIRGMRNFSNKIWNIARFIKMNMDTFQTDNKSINYSENISPVAITNEDDKKIMTSLKNVIKNTNKMITTYKFDQAAGLIYEFIWHEFADIYIEKIKDRLKDFDEKALCNALYVFKTSFTLLHPFMPFITEEINQILSEGKAKPLIISQYPGQARIYS